VLLKNQFVYFFSCIVKGVGSRVSPYLISGFILGSLLLTTGMPGRSETPVQDSQEWTVLDVYDALRTAYGERVHDMGWDFGEVFFTVGNGRIYYSGGRMLKAEHLPDNERYDPVFYQYRCGSLERPLKPMPRHVSRSRDFLEALVGSPEQIQSASRWIDFFGHRVFVHEICVDALRRIDEQVREAALISAEVANYVDSVRIIFSRDQRKIDGSESISYHAYGLALDIIPRSYEGKQVYWRWSSAWNSGWEEMPLSSRWQPPDRVIEIFEENGFVWGGKWYHFDTIHFEYRPEIIYLSRLRCGEEESTE
jgi:hypothetical protein